MELNHQCKAIARSTNNQCQKRALPGFYYCLYHTEKRQLLISLLLGAFVSLAVRESYRWFFPSKELVELRQASSRGDSLLKENQRLLQENKTLLDGISQYKTDLEAKTKRVQDLQASVGNAEEEAVALRRDIEALRASGPRKLTRDQIAEWARELKKYSRTTADLWIIAPPNEAHNFTIQLSEVLRDAGWSVDLNRYWHTYSKGAYHSGIEIEARYEEGDPHNIRKPANAVHRLLKAAGFKSKISELQGPNNVVHIEVLPKP